MCSVRRRTLILPGRSPRFTPDGIGACRAHSAGLGWPSSTASTQPATLEGEWLGYAALLVQVDRIVVDLSGSLPS